MIIFAISKPRIFKIHKKKRKQKQKTEMINEKKNGQVKSNQVS